MFFSEIEIDFANYADDTTPYNLKKEKVVASLGQNAGKLFQWFYNNFLKVNPEKCYFLTNIQEKMTINIRLEKTLNNSSGKLLEMHIASKLSFDEHVKILCRKASQKLKHYQKLRIINLS